MIRETSGGLSYLFAAFLLCSGPSAASAATKTPGDLALVQHLITGVEREGGFLTPESGLDAAAGMLAEIAATQGDIALDDAAVREALWEVGAADFQVMHIAMNLAADKEPEIIAARLLGRPGSHWRNYNRIGIASVERNDGSRVTVIVAIRRLVVTGKDWAGLFRFQLLPGVKNPSLVATLPDGKTYRGKVALVDEGKRMYEAAVPVGVGGLYKVEILVEGPSGTEVAIVFPLMESAQGDSSTALVNENEHLSKSPGARMADFVAAERARFDLPRLTFHGGATEVAQGHCQEMLNQGIAHRLESGEPGDRLARAGIAYGRVTENIALADSVEEAHLLFMSSPGHRANILDDRVDHYGIAVVDGGSRYPRKVLVAEVFFRILVPGDVTELRERVLTTLVRIRRANGLPQMQRHSKLEQAAQVRLNAAIAAHDPHTEVPEVDAILGEIRFKHPDAGEIRSELIVVENPEDVAQLASLAKPDLHQFGIAVAQPIAPGIEGAGRIWIVVVSMERRMH